MEPLTRPRMLGSYVLGRRIGAGGMAIVFAALQRGPRGVGRLVALKSLSTALAADSSFLEMFVREARLATRLEHPNIVRTYEVGEDDGIPHIVMEYVHGASLAKLMKASSEPVPLPIALRIGSDVARGLHAAHELCDLEGTPLGLVHQDVSPQNVMIGYDGSVKVLDFGVARVGALDASRTQTVRGKPAYLAPEQILGDRIDRRTDVFALGIVLHELVTGKRLFGRDLVDLSHRAILLDPIPSVRESAPDVPEAIAEIIERALARAPEARFATAEALREAMGSAASRAGVPLANRRNVAEWCAERVAPSSLPAELEREIVSALPRIGAVPPPDVSELPTLATNAGRRASGIAPHRWLPWAVAALSIAAAGALLLLSGGTPGAGVPSLSSAMPLAASAAGSMSAMPSSSQRVPPISATAAVASERAPAPLARSASGRPFPSGAPSPTGKIEALGPAPARQDGEVSISSNDPGRAYVDGAYVGDTPLSRIRLAPGAHSVRVTTRAGTQQQSVVVTRNGHERVRFMFLPQSGPAR